MALQDPDWHLFRAFLAVARQGSLLRAALEASLCVTLFTRSLDGLALSNRNENLLRGDADIAVRMDGPHKVHWLRNELAGLM